MPTSTVSSRSPPRAAVESGRILDPHRLLLIFGGSVLLIIIALASALIVQLRATAIEKAEKDMSNLSAVLVEQTARSLQSVELVLDAIQPRLRSIDLSAQPDLRALHQLLRNRIATLPQIRYATIIGPDGRLLVSSSTYPAPQIWMNDRFYFTAHRDHPAEQPFVAEPIQSKTTHDWQIAISRGLTAADGSFAGTLNMLVAPEYFESVYKSVTVAEGTAISLVRNDGLILARYPGGVVPIGVSIADRPLFRELPRLPDGRTIKEIGFYNPGLRFFAPRAVLGYPLLVIPSISEAAVSAGWMWQASLVAAGAIASAIAIVVLLAYLARLFGQLAVARNESELAREAADQANRAKSNFLANMSHELRTPLNAILGFSELIQDARIGPLHARYREYGRDVHTSGQYLLRLINDVLDTAKLEVDRLELEEESFSIDEVVVDCCRLLAEKANERGVTLTTAVPPSLPRVHADRLRLKQILLNLLSNAVKFTPSGGRVNLSAAVPAAGGLLLAVSDTGIGMRAEDIPRALEPFRQTDNALSRRYEGTGLGLPLAKTLTELHGGRLEVESAVGTGTTVRVWLPPSRLIKIAAGEPALEWAAQKARAARLRGLPGPR